MTEKQEVRKRIIVAEDDSQVRDYLGLTLRCLGYEPQLMVDGEEVKEYFDNGGQASLILLDIMMPNKDGWETLSDVQKMRIGVPVVMLSGLATPINVVEAIRKGAVNFLAKPVEHSELCRVIEQTISGKPNAVEVRSREGEFVRSADKRMFVGKSAAMKQLDSCIATVSASDVPVLIQGETGTGKEILAREIHTQSPRAGRRFVKLNCAAIPSELIESELFGHERGAYTGAMHKKFGLFELADQGTIFLDEIGDMDIRLQAKLLQVLQDQEFRRIGGTEDIRVHVRVIAATNRNLAEAVEAGSFREDLFYRLNIFTLTLPALRERKEDIPELFNRLIRTHNTASTAPAVTPELRHALVNHTWPGNIRQLENVARKFLVLRDPQRITDELKFETEARNAQRNGPELVFTPKSVNGKPPAMTEVSRANQEAEARAILDALHRSNWNRKQAAAMLNIEYKGLLYKM
jgi:two-component system response regulator AtoC